MTLRHGLLGFCSHKVAGRQGRDSKPILQILPCLSFHVSLPAAFPDISHIQSSRRLGPGLLLLASVPPSQHSPDLALVNSDTGTQRGRVT